MNKSGKSNSIIVWILLLIGLGVALWLVLKPSNKMPEPTTQSQIKEPQPENSAEVYDGPESTAQNNESTYIPQHSEGNPKRESVDPFTTHRDFEVVISSSKNRTDFDFNFGDPDNVPNYKLKNGTIDFELNGTVKTGAVLEDNVSLNIEFCKTIKFLLRSEKLFNFLT